MSIGGFAPLQPPHYLSLTKQHLTYFPVMGILPLQHPFPSTTSFQFSLFPQHTALEISSAETLSSFAGVEGQPQIKAGGWPSLPWLSVSTRCGDNWCLWECLQQSKVLVSSHGMVSICLIFVSFLSFGNAPYLFEYSLQSSTIIL